MASILNSQDGMACIEDAPWRLANEHFMSIEHFSVFCTSLEAQFLYLGLPAPEIRNIRQQSEVYPIYCAHMRKLFTCELLGFKSTMLSLDDIQVHVRRGAKILLMRRAPEHILRSWVARISPDLKSAEYQLAHYLKSINYFNIPSSLANNVCVLDYEGLTADPAYSLRRVSEFLDADVCMPSVRFHSYNKGRASFDRNDSSALVTTATEGAGSGDELLVNRLRRLYSCHDFEISAHKVMRGLSFEENLRFLARESFKKVARRVFGVL